MSSKTEIVWILLQFGFENFVLYFIKVRIVYRRDVDPKTEIEMVSNLGPKRCIPIKDGIKGTGAPGHL